MTTSTPSSTPKNVAVHLPACRLALISSPPRKTSPSHTFPRQLRLRLSRSNKHLPNRIPPFPALTFRRRQRGSLLARMQSAIRRRLPLLYPRTKGLEREFSRSYSNLDLPAR